MSTSRLLSSVQPRNLVGKVTGVVELSAVKWTVTLALGGY